METHDERRTTALARLRGKREFRQHALVYGAVNTLLVIIWAASGAGYFWPIWAIAGWGIGLALHAWQTYGQRAISDADIEKEMQRLERPPSRPTR